MNCEVLIALVMRRSRVQIPEAAPIFLTGLRAFDLIEGQQGQRLFQFQSRVPVVSLVGSDSLRCVIFLVFSVISGCFRSNVTVCVSALPVVHSVRTVFSLG